MRRGYRMLLFTVALFLVIALLLYASWRNVEPVDAQLANFYPATCSGGWQQSENATGEPDVSDGAYNEDNSAVFSDNAATIYCNDFSGTLPPATYHTRVFLRFSWEQARIPVAEEPIDAINEEEGVPDTDNMSENDATSTVAEETLEEEVLENEDEVSTSTTEEGATEDTSIPVEETVEEPIIEDVPVETEPVVEEETVTEENEVLDEPVSDPEETPSDTSDTPEIVSWNWQSVFGPRVALAQEVATSSEVIDTAPTTSPEVIKDDVVADVLENPYEIVEEVVRPPIPANAQFEIKYTIDGEVWQTVGFVASIDNDVRFEIPKEVLGEIEDIASLQIAIEPLMQYDSVPDVYLDAMWLEVAYAPVGELGVHSISPLVPTIGYIDEVIVSDPALNGTSTRITQADFVAAITRVHGIDERFVYVTTAKTATTSEVWLFDIKAKTVHHIGFDEAVVGAIKPAAKEGMLFWLNAMGDKFYTYDLRTMGKLHQMQLVQNLPLDTQYEITFPFTAWKMIWRGDALYFTHYDTGEVFEDENTTSAKALFTYFDLEAVLPYDKIYEIGGSFIEPAGSTE